MELVAQIGGPATFQGRRNALNRICVHILIIIKPELKRLASLLRLENPHVHAIYLQ
jgi:hypothetical protein